MTTQLNHTIVYARNKDVSATFLADILGIPTSPPVARSCPSPWTTVTLDYMNATDMGLTEPQPQHYAFLVSDDTFDQAFARIAAAGIA